MICSSIPFVIFLLSFVNAFVPNTPSSTSSSLSMRVMINGLPGPMATSVAEACLRKGLTLAPYGLTGPNIKPSPWLVTDPDTGNSASVTLVNDVEQIGTEALQKMRAECDDIVVIDYTHPTAVNGNAEWYVKNKLPFVMGTTGGDREKLVLDVTKGKLFAVIAPNMGKQIVAMQQSLGNLAKTFPSAFSGYKLKVVESHQKTKADTSGTALAVIESINEMTSPGSNFDVDDVTLTRTDEGSLAFGVPKEFVTAGHAYHTYTLTSPDGTVEFELKHNVNGRRVYAEGSADAVKFLNKKVEEGGEAKIFNMIDVLESGSLEDVIIK